MIVRYQKLRDGRRSTWCSGSRGLKKKIFVSLDGAVTPPPKTVYPSYERQTEDCILIIIGRYGTQHVRQSVEDKGNRIQAKERNLHIVLVSTGLVPTPCFLQSDRMDYLPYLYIMPPWFSMSWFT